MLPSRTGPGYFKVTFTLLALSGCSVGPDFTSPPPPDLESFTPEKLTRIDEKGGKDDIRFDIGQAVPRKWWETFKDKKLNRLIEACIERSPTLVAAEEAIKIAYYNAEAQKGAFLPTVNLTSTDASIRQSYQQAYQNNAPTNPAWASGLYPRLRLQKAGPWDNS
jgi:outer membrane protein TolC